MFQWASKHKRLLRCAIAPAIVYDTELYTACTSKADTSPLSALRKARAVASPVMRCLSAMRRTSSAEISAGAQKPFATAAVPGEY
jgi:hypothetical protein